MEKEVIKTIGVALITSCGGTCETAICGGKKYKYQYNQLFNRAKIIK
ncbi:MAG: hypothetical protein ACP5MX_01710 [Candidatus Micrarchaeia archaeon]